MGRPEHPLNFFSYTYNVYNYDQKKEAKRLPASYSLMAFIHDRELPHLKPVNNGIITSSEIIEKTLSAPRNQLEGRIIDSDRSNAGEDVREIYLIEEHYNHVRVDLKYISLKTELEEKRIKIIEELERMKTISDNEFFESIAKIFNKREFRVLEKDETWYELDNSLRPWFDVAIQRLKQADKENDIGSLQYKYDNLLHFARGINRSRFRGFADSQICDLACKQIAELAQKFQDIAKSVKEDIRDKKPAEKEQQEPQRKDGQVDAYIPFTKAIELSNGLLTRKKLDKAIEHGKPVKVRDKKPSKQRRNVNIQDVLLLINKLSANEKTTEEAARMFGEYKKAFQKKISGKINLD